jgi:hypothetical protein
VSWIREKKQGEMIVGNTFSFFMLAIWPLLTLYLFATRSTYNAIFVSIVGGYMLLPELVEFDFPFIPALDKHSIPALSIVVAFVIVKRKRLRLLPTDRLTKCLVLLFIFAPLLSFFSNQEVVFNGQVLVKGINLYDVLSLSIGQALLLLPMLIGFQLCRRPEQLSRLLSLFVMTALLYALPILFEVRFSPQLHTWVYGFFPHSFGQQIRNEGYRPVVFLGHGLLVANFVSLALAFISILIRLKITLINGVPNLPIFLILVFLLIFCKSLAALIFAIVMVPVILMGPMSFVRLCTLIIASILLIYPMMMIFELFPHDKIVHLFGLIDPSRAQSLQFRFSNEVELVEHVKSKIFFGWNGWGRSRLATSTTDSYWIILFGKYGLLGLFSFFSLITLLIWRGLKVAARLPNGRSRHLLVLVSFVISIFMLDQLVNDSLKSFAFLLIGAYAGLVNHYLIRIRLANKASSISMGRDPAGHSPQLHK